MAQNKTHPTAINVSDFINAFDNDQKLKDSKELIQLMSAISSHPPVMWGPSIIGFGSYHYKYASGHQGDAPLIGFSPRKAATSLYVFTGLEEHQYLLENLGKYKIGKACIYIKKLADINKEVLVEMMKATIQYLQLKYPNEL